MGERAQALADRLEQANQALLAMLSACSEDDWGKQVGSDKRPVGVIAHHVAAAQAFVLGLAQEVAAGRPLPALTWDMVHQGNAQHAEQQAGCPKAETLELLRRNSAESARVIRGMSDEQLSRSSTWDLSGNVTTERVIEVHMIDHVHEHLATIKAVTDTGAVAERRL
jgi:hypothetical protein